MNNNTPREAVFKATRPDTSPPKEKHVLHLLYLAEHSNSLPAIGAIMARTADSDAKVAVKALALLHRLLRDGPDNAVADLNARVASLAAARTLNDPSERALSALAHSYSDYLATKAVAACLISFAPDNVQPSATATWVSRLSRGPLARALPLVQRVLDKILEIDPRNSVAAYFSAVSATNAPYGGGRRVTGATSGYGGGSHGPPFPVAVNVFTMLIRDAFRCASAQNLLLKSLVSHTDVLGPVSVAILARCAENVAPLRTRMQEWFADLIDVGIISPQSDLAAEALAQLTPLPASAGAVIAARLQILGGEPGDLAAAVAAEAAALGGGATGKAVADQLAASLNTARGVGSGRPTIQVVPHGHSAAAAAGAGGAGVYGAGYGQAYGHGHAQRRPVPHSGGVSAHGGAGVRGTWADPTSLPPEGHAAEALPLPADEFDHEYKPSHASAHTKAYKGDAAAGEVHGFGPAAPGRKAPAAAAGTGFGAGAGAGARAGSELGPAPPSPPPQSSSASKGVLSASSKGAAAKPAAAPKGAVGAQSKGTAGAQSKGPAGGKGPAPASKPSVEYDFGDFDDVAVPAGSGVVLAVGTQVMGHMPLARAPAPATAVGNAAPARAPAPAPAAAPAPAKPSMAQVPAQVQAQAQAQMAPPSAPASVASSSSSDDPYAMFEADFSALALETSDPAPAAAAPAAPAAAAAGGAAGGAGGRGSSVEGKKPVDVFDLLSSTPVTSTPASAAPAPAAPGAGGGASAGAASGGFPSHPYPHAHGSYPPQQPQQQHQQHQQHAYSHHQPHHPAAAAAAYGSPGPDGYASHPPKPTPMPMPMPVPAPAPVAGYGAGFPPLTLPHGAAYPGYIYAAPQGYAVPVAYGSPAPVAVSPGMVYVPQQQQQQGGGVAPPPYGGWQSPHPPHQGRM